MKKIYIEPTTNVYCVKIESLLTVLSAEGTTNSGEADSRRNNNWDED